MSTTLTRLPGPGATAAAYGMDVQFDGTGRYLAVITAPYPDTDPFSYPPGRITWYRRDGDTLIRLPDPAQTPTAPYTCRWTPNGRHLVVATRSGTPNIPADFDTTSRIWVYRRDGDTLVQIGTVPDADYNPDFDLYETVAAGRRLSFPYGGWDFDHTGRYLVTGSVGGLQALLRLDGDALTIRSGYRTGVYRASYTAGFHPKNNGILSLQLAYALGQPQGINLIRRPDETFPEVAYAQYRGFDGGKALGWHPGGKVFLSPQDKGTGRGEALGVAPHLYRFDEALLDIPYSASVQRLGWLEEFTGVYAGFSFDPSGTWLAGGPAYDGDGPVVQLPGDFGAAHNTPDLLYYYAGGTYLGLTVARVPGNPAELPGGAIARTAPVDGVTDVARYPQVAGLNTTWASDTGGLYLAAGGGYLGNGDPDLLPGGFALFRLDPVAAPTTTSTLYQRTPAGAMELVGTETRPVSMRMPDGSMRTWPGSTAPLYMRMPDGSWRQVVG